MGLHRLVGTDIYTYTYMVKDKKVRDLLRNYTNNCLEALQEVLNEENGLERAERLILINNFNIKSMYDIDFLPMEIHKRGELDRRMNHYTLYEFDNMLWVKIEGEENGDFHISRLHEDDKKRLFNDIACHIEYLKSMFTEEDCPEPRDKSAAEIVDGLIDCNPQILD